MYVFNGNTKKLIGTYEYAVRFFANIIPDYAGGILGCEPIPETPTSSGGYKVLSMSADGVTRIAMFPKVPNVRPSFDLKATPEGRVYMVHYQASQEDGASESATIRYLDDFCDVSPMYQVERHAAVQPRTQRRIDLCSRLEGIILVSDWMGHIGASVSLLLLALLRRRAAVAESIFGGTGGFYLQQRPKDDGRQAAS